MNKPDKKLTQYISPELECIEVDAFNCICQDSTNPPGDDVHFGDDWF